MRRQKILAVIMAGFFLFLDQFLKGRAIGNWSKNLLLNKFFGWQPFLNDGAAFGIPLPGVVIIIMSTLIIGLFLFLLLKGEAKNNYPAYFALTLATAGAISNLFDRVLYGHTIDYILIFTGIINLADVLIVVGITGFIYFSKYLNK